MPRYSCCAGPSEAFMLHPGDQVLLLNGSQLRGTFVYEASAVCLSCATERHTFRREGGRLEVLTVKGS